MTIPEIVLLETLQAALEFVRKDYNDATDKTTSYLYLLLSGVKLDKYDMFTQAQQVICSKKDDPRRFNVDLMFNVERNGAPTAHITLPSETTGQGNGLGTDEGYEDYMFTDVDGDGNDDNFRAVFTRRLQATYQVVVTSDNSNEVILIYHFIRALLIALIPHLHEKGIQNVRFGGQDIQPYAELAGQLYMRAVTLSLEYDTSIPAIHVNELKYDIVVDGKPVD